VIIKRKLDSARSRSHRLMTTGSGYRFLGGSSVWFPLIALFGLGLLVGILLKWWAQKTRIYSGTLFKLCHRPRSNDLVWIAAFNQCTAQLPSTYGPDILPSLLHLLHPLTPLQAPFSQLRRPTAAAPSSTTATPGNSPSIYPLAPSAPKSPRLKWEASFGTMAATTLLFASTMSVYRASSPSALLRCVAPRYQPRRLFLPPSLLHLQLLSVTPHREHLLPLCPLPAK